MNSGNLFNASPEDNTIKKAPGVNLLILVAGLFSVIGASIGSLISSATGKLNLDPSTVFPVLTVALLILILSALLILVKCCSCGKVGNIRGLPGDLLKMLPLLSQIPEVMRKTAHALRQSSEALGVINQNLKVAGETLSHIPGNINNPSVIVPKFDTHEFGRNTGLYYISNLAFESKEIDLDSLSSQLATAGRDLEIRESQNMEQLRSDIILAADALDTLADALP